MGGSATAAGLPQDAARARALAHKLADKVGCPAEPSAELLSCLRAKPARDLVAHEAALKDGGLCPLVTWGPVVEDFVDDATRRDQPPFLDQHPVDALTSGLALEVPWMAGMNLHDGGFWVCEYSSSVQYADWFRR